MGYDSSAGVMIAGDGTRLDYQAYYCEENVWRALQHPRFAGAPVFAVFISNPTRTCPVWGMRVSERRDQPALWDYHVVLLESRAGRPFIWDCDSLLGMPCEGSRYVAQSFRVGLKPEYRPLFRVVPEARLLAEFHSDRRHMKTGPSHLVTPPPWPCPGDGHSSNLVDYLDMADDALGAVYDLEAFSAMMLVPFPS